MKRAALTDHFIQSALKRTVALGIISFLSVSTAADFTDANWISMGGIPGADGTVHAAAADDLGNLYIGGDFIVVGDIIANYIAKWDGHGWTTLGSGVNSQVDALAVSGSNVYAGGYFTKA